MSAVASISQILPGVPVISPSPIKAKGSRRAAQSEGQRKLAVAVTDTPTGGDPSTQSVNVKLKKKL